MIYFLQPVDGGPVKIGFSDNLEARRIALELHYGRQLSVLATLPGGREEEKAIHERFAHLRLGRTEQFRPAPDLMEFINRPLLVDANPDVIEAIESVAPQPVSIRCSVIWKNWLTRLAAFRRLKATDVIDQVLVEYAEKHGFKEEAPPR